MTFLPPEGGRFAARAPFALPVAILSVVLAMLPSTGLAAAHAVAEGDKGYIQEITGVYLIPSMYLGAKHMVTGYDHLLFLLGVVFFLYRPQHMASYVSRFAIGHSTTMILGVYYGWNVSAYLIDAIIGLSVVYKALDNLGAFQRWFGVQPNTKAATLCFRRHRGGQPFAARDRHRLRFPAARSALRAE